MTTEQRITFIKEMLLHCEHRLLELERRDNAEAKLQPRARKRAGFFKK